MTSLLHAVLATSLTFSCSTVTPEHSGRAGAVSAPGGVTGAAPNVILLRDSGVFVGLPLRM